MAPHYKKIPGLALKDCRVEVWSADIHPRFWFRSSKSKKSSQHKLSDLMMLSSHWRKDNNSKRSSDKRRSFFLSQETFSILIHQIWRSWLLYRLVLLSLSLEALLWSLSRCVSSWTELCLLRLIFVCDHRPKTKEWLEFLYLLFFTIRYKWNIIISL